jgi:Bacterial PH domain
MHVLRPKETTRVKQRLLNLLQPHLAPGETVQVRTGPHWIVYLRSIIAAVMILAVGTALAYEAMFGTSAHAQIYAAMSAATIGIAIAILASATLQRRSQIVLVTDGRILEISGVLHRVTSEMRIAAVQSSTIDQNILGRLLNFGTVTLRTGNEDPMVLRNIAFPQELHQALLDQRPQAPQIALGA